MSTIIIAVQEKIARKFSELLLADLGRETMEAINKINRYLYGSTDFCATHDYVDASEYMYTAMQEVLGGLECPEDFTDQHVSIWHESWTLAKNNNFYINE